MLNYFYGEFCFLFKHKHAVAEVQKDSTTEFSHETVLFYNLDMFCKNLKLL